MISAISGGAAQQQYTSVSASAKPVTARAGAGEEATESASEKRTEITAGEEASHRIDVYA